MAPHLGRTPSEHNGAMQLSAAQSQSRGDSRLPSTTKIPFQNNFILKKFKSHKKLQKQYRDPCPTPASPVAFTTTGLVSTSVKLNARNSLLCLWRTFHSFHAALTQNTHNDQAQATPSCLAPGCAPAPAHSTAD